MTSSDIYGRPALPRPEIAEDKLPAGNTTGRDTPKTRSRGRPTKSEQLLRERTRSCGSIHRFLGNSQDYKRKRSDEQTDTSPNDTPAKKITSTQVAGPANSTRTSNTSSSATAGNEGNEHGEMDKVFEELKRMGEKSANQFKSVSAQISTASKKQEKSLDDLRTEIRECKTESAKAYTELQQQIKQLEKKFTSKEAATNARIKDLEKQIAEMKKAKRAPEAAEGSSQLQKKIEHLEKDIRKNNIIIHGFQVHQEALRDEIENFISSEFGLQNSILEVASIPNRARKNIIRVKLVSWETKLSILRQKRSLMGRDIFIDQDLTIKERQTAKKLRDIYKARRAEGHTVKMGYNKLYIDNIPYYWSEKDKNVKKSNRAETNEDEGDEQAEDGNPQDSSDSAKN